MTSDYAAIREENRTYYGTGVGTYGPPLLAERYAERTHFIFEILQNAEDALARLSRQPASRAVSFDIEENALRISHYGDPFNEQDVRSICRIAESNKNSLTAIGKFGIGFKSVYAFTDRPEIHSGHNQFCINNLVFPTEIHPIEKDLWETIIRLPFDKADVHPDTAKSEIAGKLRGLDMKTLLFLQEISEIRWKIGEGNYRVYSKETQVLEPFVKKVRLSSTGEPEMENWIVFSHPVYHQGEKAGAVQIAFLIEEDSNSDQWSISDLQESPLFAFFETAVETNFNFLMHGPYRTTPSRDNIPPHDQWNIDLINQTADLLKESIHWIRDQRLLTADILEKLPLESGTVRQRTPSMFAPIPREASNVVRWASVLPIQDGKYISSENGKLGTEDVREIIDPSQLTTLFSKRTEQFWLSDTVRQQRTPYLYNFLTTVCKVPSVNPAWLLRNFTQHFLEQQTDEWVQRLYAFFYGRRLSQTDRESAPLIRLENGRHVRAIGDNGIPSAYLPGEHPTEFPTVRSSICENEDAVAFLKEIGLHEVDQIADEHQHIIPKYRNKQYAPDKEEYTADMQRILAAFDTASRQRKDELVSQLRDVQFIRSIESQDKESRMVIPSAAYWPTSELMTLFSGMTEIIFFDTEIVPHELEQSLKTMLSSYGMHCQLHPIRFTPQLSRSEKRKIRKERGHVGITESREETIEDWRIDHLSNVLETLSTLPLYSSHKPEALWNLLIELWSTNADVFHGTYQWYHYDRYQQEFSASFVKILQNTPWISGSDGALLRPSEVLFDDLAWVPHPELQKRIGFKSPAIAELEELCGFEPGMLDRLKARGITNLEELEKILPLPPAPQPRSPESGDTPRQEPRPYGRVTRQQPQSTTGDARSSPRGSGTHSPGQPRTQNEGFISYVAVHPEDRDPEPSDAERKRRLDLEHQAVQLIQRDDPAWIAAPPNTPGYDLYSLDENGEAIEWCEVKALSGSLDNGPVRMSRTQFDFAREQGDACWLYVVEYAADPAQARILKIQNPAGLARTFTFDRGWRDVALRD